MVSKKDSNKARLKRRKRVRAKISGTAACPRLSVYRSLNHIYTLASAATVEKEFEYGGNKEAATKVGELLAKRAAEKGITECVFDRGGYVYHGRVQALADGARAGGLKF